MSRIYWSTVKTLPRLLTITGGKIMFILGRRFSQLRDSSVEGATALKD